MCYRIFFKPQHGHTTEQIAELSSLQGALGELEMLTDPHKHRYGKWTVRNTRGELVAKVNTSPPPVPCTFWTIDQVVCM